MELGEKLRQTRLEAGLSQRQLCGEEITRNMLSLIENGSAKPSMKTLQYLAARLGKPVGYFLGEAAPDSPNGLLMEAARTCFDAGDYTAALEALDSFQAPDPVHSRERDLLRALCHLALAAQAIADNRRPYALDLLQKADIPTAYCADSLRRRRLLLLARAGEPGISAQLPSLDEELQLRARDALTAQNAPRAAALLEAMEDHSTAHWHLLRGEVSLLEQAWQAAVPHLLLAETDFPREAIPKLEQCYRELGDYKQAYEYACKQKEKPSPGMGIKG